MLGSYYRKCNSEQCVGTGGIYTHLFALLAAVDIEVNECSYRLSYPVFLLHSDVGKIVNVIQTLKKLVGILRDSKIPYVL